jgi:hypothetical protein
MGKTLQERMLVEGSEFLQMLAKHEETFPPATIPGLYPIVYIDGHGEELCADCAEAQLAEAEAADPVDRDIFQCHEVWDAYIHYEGPSVFCYHCNKEIEAAYGDPWAEEEADD